MVPMTQRWEVIEVGPHRTLSGRTWKVGHLEDWRHSLRGLVYGGCLKYGYLQKSSIYSWDLSFLTPPHLSGNLHLWLRLNIGYRIFGDWSQFCPFKAVILLPPKQNQSLNEIEKRDRCQFVDSTATLRYAAKTSAFGLLLVTSHEVSQCGIDIRVYCWFLLVMLSTRWHMKYHPHRNGAKKYHLRPPTLFWGWI